MPKTFWDNAEAINEETLALQVDGFDLMYLKKVGREEGEFLKCAECMEVEAEHPLPGCDTFRKILTLADYEVQDWFDLTALAPKMLETLKAVKTDLVYAAENLTTEEEFVALISPLVVQIAAVIHEVEGRKNGCEERGGE